MRSALIFIMLSLLNSHVHGKFKLKFPSCLRNHSHVIMGRTAKRFYSVVHLLTPVHLFLAGQFGLFGSGEAGLDDLEDDDIFIPTLQNDETFPSRGDLPDGIVWPDGAPDADNMVCWLDITY